jgi:hypothetical protein
VTSVDVTAATMFTRFFAGRDGREFRRATFESLATRYRSHVLAAIELLRELRFTFPAIEKAHAEQLRSDLIFRHALPFCVTEDAYFGLSAESDRVLAAVLACHTLALTQLDYHLDGSFPDSRATATAAGLTPATAVAYALRMVYAVPRLLPEPGLVGRLFADAFEPVSGFVIERMHEDWSERYTAVGLELPAERLREYLESQTSRLLGSGYWEVMVRGAFSGHGAVPPDALIEVVRELRRLRQVVDEVADFEEDLRAGLVTLPLLFALIEGDGGALREMVLGLWDAPERAEPVGEIRAAVTALGGFERCCELADGMWRGAVARCADELGERGAGFAALLDLKRAKLAELAENGWCNSVTQPFFP